MPGARFAVAVVVLLSFTAGVRADPGRASLLPLDAEDWSPQMAAHLLRRAAFGGNPDQVRKFHEMGLDAAVDWLVDFQDIPFQPPPPPVDPLVLEPPDRAELRALSPEERQRYQQQQRRAHRQTFEEVRLWWIERMIESPRPLEERMTLFWHGHFTSGMREVRNGLFMKEQNELLRRRALGNFRDLVLDVSRDRAMLTYLDGNRNRKAQPNENYARELLELFTLGLGNYSEADIKAAARAFTGWTYDREGFVFLRREHDFGRKQFLGKSGPFDGADIVDIILEQQACSRFLATKLLQQFCRPDPPKALIEALAREIRDNKYEMRPVMRMLLKSQAFYHPESRGSLVKSPVELVVGTARMLGVSVGDLQSASRAMIAMGQELMQPPNVKGWDGGEKWINTATLFTRYNVVGGLIYGDPRAARRDAAAMRPMTEAPENDEVASVGGTSVVVDDPSMQMMGQSPSPASRLRGRPIPPLDVMRFVREQELTTAEQIVDFFGRHLLATPLASSKREQLVSYLIGEDGDFSIEDSGEQRRIATTLHLLCSTPEFQLH